MAHDREENEAGRPSQEQEPRSRSARRGWFSQEARAGRRQKRQERQERRALSQRAHGKAVAVPRRRLVVLSGPTAVGKGTVEAALRARHPEVWVSVSATTRKPRPGEKDGVDYYFVSPEKFARMRRNNEFLETAIVHNMANYGTPLQPVLEHLSSGIPTILEIDLQGARRVRVKAAELGIDVLFVFLAPPSFDDLITRLAERGTENEEQRMKRLATARIELAAEKEFDRIIVNDRVERAADELWKLIAEEYGLAPTQDDDASGDLARLAADRPLR